ncbi:ADP-ribosylglycohydrolase family protein [Bacillus sp. FJAT-49705]|uniref:ADP-ribosylglycohydrolase family protein n=1 Tax=Cytobacillus citreus TaxID=2833586 RepID=A0ABS5NS27_9BACI|nr:ADP-ribosylglycohydrolase family protein [Cytobacillus citreus]MBS4189739.1 ADP-ribosylglycohydrolase family protein [Cytobacillus citreus]
MILKNYLEKVYAGFLGMNVGIRLGAPVEPIEWTLERIHQFYGEIKGYVKDYKMFAADDDANGPIFFIRALYDDAIDREVTAEDIGKAWLNYARDGIGMFWWGGEGVSTEHTAYNNLKKGIPAPRSGSADLNGIILAEQIGGQIFIDTWGLLYPNNIEKAAHYAEMAASVSHDKNGIFGARFIAACISKAFSASSIEEVIEAGLSTIPGDSLYAKVVQAVVNFHQKHPNDFRLCRQYLEDEWGYDKYPGICHIIPNAGVCVLSLLYGKGSFARTIEIATMCGWDTDCNAGNVGTIVGVLYGIEDIPNHYRKPINDHIVTSSVSGYLNNLDIPTFAKELALLGYRVSGMEPPKSLVDSVKNGEVYFDFSFPGSTHGFRTNNSCKTILKYSEEKGYNRLGSLEVMFDRMVEVDESKIFYKPFYRRAEFNDEKYKPTFAPTAYSDQTVSVKIFLDQWQGDTIILTPYVRKTYKQDEIRLQPVVLKNQDWNHIEFIIPETDGDFIDEIGYIVQSPSTLTNRAFGRFFLDQFHISGNADYSIDFEKQSVEFKCITPFAHNNGEWTLDDGSMKCESINECSSYTGNYYAKDFIVGAVITPESGFSHCVIFRAIGVKRHYLAGLDGEGQVSLILNDFGLKRLESVPFQWELGKSYHFKITCRGSNITFSIDDKILIQTSDSRLSYGMYGYGCLEAGVSRIHTFQFQAIN